MAGGRCGWWLMRLVRAKTICPNRCAAEVLSQPEPSSHSSAQVNKPSSCPRWSHGTSHAHGRLLIIPSSMAVSYNDALGSSRMLSSSVSSLSSSRHQSSQIAKAYRQAAQLFLTRRLPEALSTIEPIITPPPIDDTNGSYNGDLSAFAPVASASRGTRVKVWSFYLTFLNSVIELGAEEGKHAFGSTQWKALVSKCRDGSIWEDVVRDGYAGVEGDVDAEVVVNL